MKLKKPLKIGKENENFSHKQNRNIGVLNLVTQHKRTFNRKLKAIKKFDTHQRTFCCQYTYTHTKKEGVHNHRNQHSKTPTTTTEINKLNNKNLANKKKISKKNSSW